MNETKKLRDTLERGKVKVSSFPLYLKENILIPPDLHKSSVIHYCLNKIIFTECSSKRKQLI